MKLIALTRLSDTLEHEVIGMGFWKDAKDQHAAFEASVKNRGVNRPLAEPKEDAAPHEPLTLQTSDAPHVQKPPSGKWKTYVCWGAGLLFVVVGLTLSAESAGWHNELVTGFITAVGGIFLLPPLLERTRRQLAFFRPSWVPFVFAVLLFVVPPLIALPFKPSAAERARLRPSAIASAETLLSAGHPELARLELRRFKDDRLSDPALASIYRRIEQAKKVVNPARDGAKASIQKKLPATSASTSELDFPHLKPADRFLEYGVGENHRAAQDALNAGDVAKAYNTFGERDRPLDGPREKRFGDVLETAFQQWSNSSPASDFAERIETYWLPEARSLPDTSPPDSDFEALLSKIDGLVSDLESGDGLELTPTQASQRSKLMGMLSAKQVKLFPKLRRTYAKALDAKLFRHDVRVTANGSTLRLTGGMFARNANVEDMQVGLGPSVSRLRFKRVEYRWSAYLDDGSHYDLGPPGDAVVARWYGSYFIRLKR